MGQKCPILTKEIMKKTILIVACALALAACGKKQEVAAPVEPVAPAEPAAPVEKPNLDQQLSAMVRPYERMIKVCHEGLRNSAFFVLFKPPADGNSEGLLVGWYLVEGIEFYKASNNTWFMTDIADNKFVKVYPEIDGLTCRDKNVTTP